MKKLKLYSFHKNIPPDRFDAHNTQRLITALSSTYSVEWMDLEGDGSFMYHGVPIDHGSILIFELEDTGDFKIYDFGDSPRTTVKFVNVSNFKGAAIGQYNPALWNTIVQDPTLRSKIKPSVYPETYWHFGEVNYNAAYEYRQQIILDERLYWRGSMYNVNVPSEYLGVRRVLEILPTVLQESEFYFGNFPIPFESYIAESMQFKLALSCGGGGGYICGDFCFRDIELFGLGVPVLRPRYVVETVDPLIPDYHYISVDADFTDEFKYKEPSILATKLAQRYKEVVKNTEYLEEVAKNARNWYIKNITAPNITSTILTALEL